MINLNLRGLLRLLPVLFLPLALFAQKTPKFGKITPEELQSASCPIDPSADAYFLFDYGDTRLEGGAVWRLISRRHYRVKVVKQEGASLADVRLTLYTPEKNDEFIDGLKAVAYNLENGKIVESKVEKSAVFKEKTSDSYTTIKFAIPNVRAGTVFEVAYEVHSSYFLAVEPWIFQHDYPVLHSEYHASLLEDFDYRRSLVGYLPVDVKTEKGIRRIPMDGSMAELNEDIFHFSVDNVPAFRYEPYLYTDENYRSSVRFDLKSVNPRFGFQIKVASDWGEVAGNLLDHYRFGAYLQQKSPMRDRVKAYKAIANPKERLQHIFTDVQEHYTWNGNYSIYADDDPDAVYKNKKGNTAAINLALVNLLREADIDAHPVVLSTRENGRIIPGQCSANFLNQVVAVATIDSTDYYMDAADAYAYISLIPPENCNGTAIVIKKETFHPVEIKQNQIYGAHKKYNLALTGDGDLSGGGSFTFNDYAAYAKRWEIGKSGGEQAFFEKWVAKHPGANLSKHTLGALDSLDMPLTIQFEGSFNGNVEKAGNLLLVSPWVFDQNTENPFASVTRAYPVEFNYPYVQSTSAEIVIPEGYVVETLPKNIKVRLPDGSARFTFTANQKGNTITVTHAVQITRTMYSAEEYGDLRNFYQTVLDKELEKIILKKA